MAEFFEGLTDEQIKTLKDSVAWITVLIAGADGVIDESEIAWAGKLTNIRSYAAPERIKPFYSKVGEDFQDVLSNVIQTSPADTKERTEYLTSKLSQLNTILPLMSHDVAADLYQSFLSFAKHIAKSSGGFLSFMSVGADEKELLGLDMINPIK